MPRRIILYELNEVPWRVLHEFVAVRPMSYLARLLPVMHRFDTFAEDRSELSPWITWPTLHRGVTDEWHGILNFGQDQRTVDREYPPIWELLARRGVSVGVCGSLHTYPLPPAVERYSFFIRMHSRRVRSASQRRFRPSRRSTSTWRGNRRATCHVGFRGSAPCVFWPKRRS
jgi:hypothetical protein